VTRATIPRWGLAAFFAAWAIGLVAAILAVTLVVLVTDPDATDDSATVLLVALIAQTAGGVGTVWFISRRWGQASLRADFGLELRARDVLWLLAGAALQIGAGLLLLPLSLLAPDEAQSVVESFREARDGPGIIVFAVAVIVLAPFAEELLFRGVLLRALLRRTTAGWAVVWSAGIFAAVHVVFDPSVGSAQAVPVLALLGLIAGDQAVRSGSLSRPILLHAGFNLVTALGILLL
jgi:membrane protease YdiL (CAAX protease family)